MVRLSNVIEFIVDNRGKNPPYYLESGIPVIDTYLIGEGKYPDINNVNRFIDDNLYNNFIRCKNKKDDLLVTLVGNGYGNSCLCKENQIIIQNAIGLRFTENANQLYMYYYFQQKEVIKWIQNLDRGSAQPNVKVSDLKRMKFNLPSVSLQAKISLILDNYDQLIENNNKRIKLLEQMAEELYKEWFVRFRFPGYEKNNFIEGLPEGWEKVKLNDFAIELESGSRPSGGIDESLSEGIPSLGAESIGKLGEFNFSSTKLISLEYYNKMKRGKSFDNAILLYKDGAYIGKTTLFRDEFPFEKYSINEHVFLIKSKHFIFQNYLYLTLHQSAYFSLMQVLNKNSAQPGLSQPDIYRIKVIKPNQNVVSKFNELIEPIFCLIFKLAKKNRHLELQRDSLLPRLMSGKIDLEDKEVI